MQSRYNIGDMCFIPCTITKIETTWSGVVKYTVEPHNKLKEYSNWDYTDFRIPECDIPFVIEKENINGGIKDCFAKLKEKLIRIGKIIKE